MSSPVPARQSPPVRKPVTCPICGSTLSWENPELFKYEPGKEAYQPFTVPEEASEAQRNRSLRTAFVRCADPDEPGAYHYLPLAYGKHGPPVVIGFVGETESGKTHLLTAMIGQMEQQGLGHAVKYQPITLAAHKSLIEEQVSPFLNHSLVLDQTRADVVGLVGCFLIRNGDGEGRPVALFDVAGGDLLEIDRARRFLDVADGLIFVVNAADLDRDVLGDRTFRTVLALLEGSDRLPDVSAAIVLSKADLLRFEDPIALWMRQPDGTLDPAASLRESRDVYAYLHARGAEVWTRPYRECHRATLHLASATGSDAVENGVFARGVRPRRVLNPLISLLAMTGVITTPEAERIGI